VSAKPRRRATSQDDASIATLDGWTRQLARNARGDALATLANAHLCLSFDPALVRAIGLDVFRSGHVWLLPPPWDRASTRHDRLRTQVLDGDGVRKRVRHDDGKARRLLEESDYDRLCVYLDREHGVRVSPETMVRAVNLVAETLPIHEIQSYLSDARWDDVSRVATWLTRYAGVEDTPYTRAVGQWWLVSAVARAFQPGCKADHCLVLEGKQGVGKSSLFAALTGQFFSDTHLDLHNKDSFSALRGQWVVEIQEIDHLSKFEQGRVKGYLTSSRDHYRPPYARLFITAPRACVFAGTCNKREYLLDETGARRYWPVRAGRIDVAAIKRDRDLLWAEAVALYRAGERWHPETPEEKAMCEGEQSERYVEHPWTGLVESFVARRQRAVDWPGCIRLDEILEELAIEPGRRADRDAQTVGKIMHRLGWQIRRASTAVDPLRRRAYHPPALAPSDDDGSDGQNATIEPKTAAFGEDSDR
jgi:predicted P-loop ATPase